PAHGNKLYFCFQIRCYIAVTGAAHEGGVIDALAIGEYFGEFPFERVHAHLLHRTMPWVRSFFFSLGAACCDMPCCRVSLPRLRSTYRIPLDNMILSSRSL